MNCGMCDRESVARIHVATTHGAADVECCGEHLADGYTAGLMFCPKPAIIVHDGKAQETANAFLRELKRKYPV